MQVTISEVSPLIGVRLDDPVWADLYSAVVVGIRPIGHLSGALQYAKEAAGIAETAAMEEEAARRKEEAETAGLGATACELAAFCLRACCFASFVDSLQYLNVLFS